MELIKILRVVRRWFWLIVVVVVVAELALWLRMRSAEPVYAATVTLQISTPQSEDVSTYDVYRSISLRDEITVAINNFLELVQSDEVHQQTVSQLGLVDKDGHYAVAAEHVRDADFVNVTAEARTPALAAEIANTHTGLAIIYYGDLRARTTSAEKELFAEQLRKAEEEFHAAEKALADFRTENGIFSLESQMSTQQKLLEQLQLERDQRVLEMATAAITATTITTKAIAASLTATMVITTPVIDPVARVDELIAQRQKELDKFTALGPQYSILAQKADEAQAAYQHLLSKYSEAELKETAVKAANFIQIIKPAYTPDAPESSWPKLAALTLAGSLGLGVMLAFFLEYISAFKAASVTVPERDHKPPSSGPAEPAGSRIPRRLATMITRRHRPSMQVERPSQRLTADLEPIEEPDQSGSTGTKAV
jgi:uncharacterized protein involved in exopolysaccharide biosynthesis